MTRRLQGLRAVVTVKTHPTLTRPESKGIVLNMLGYLPFPRGHHWEQNATQKILTFVKEINELDGITGGVIVGCVFTHKRTDALQCEAEPRHPRREDPIPAGHIGYECVVMEIGRPDRQLCRSWLGLLRQSSSPYGSRSRRQTPLGSETKSGNLVA